MPHSINKYLCNIFLMTDYCARFWDCVWEQERNSHLPWGAYSLVHIGTVDIVMANFVNLTGLLGVQIFSLMLLWVCLWRCFRMRLILEPADWAQQIALPGAGGPHPINWRSKQNKELSKRERLRWQQSLPGFGLMLESSHQLSWVSGLPTARPGLFKCP